MPDHPIHSRRVSRRLATIWRMLFDYFDFVLTIVRGIVIIPLYLHYIDLRLYGAWLASGDVLLWLTLVGGGSNAVIRQQVGQAYGKKDIESVRQAIGGGLLLTSFTSTIVAALGVAAAPFVGPMFGMEASANSELTGAVMLMTGAVGLDMLAMSMFAVMDGLQRPVASGIANTTLNIAGLLTTIALLIQGWGLVSLPIGSLVRSVSRTLAGMWVLWYWAMRRMGLWPRVHRRGCRALASVYGWAVFNRIGEVMSDRCDAMLLGLMMGPQVVPAAIFTRRTWDMLNNFGLRFSIILTPGMAHLFGSGDLARFGAIARRSVTLMVAWSAVTAAMLWGLNEMFMTLWLDETMYAGLWYDALFGVASSVSLVMFLGLKLLFAGGNISGSSKVQMAQNTIRAVSLAMMIPLVGVLAVPISLLLGQGLVGVRYLGREWDRLTQGKGGVNLMWFGGAKLLRALPAAAAVAAAIRLLELPLNWWMLVVGCTAAAAAAAGALAMIDRDFRSEIVVAWRLIDRRLRSI